MAHDESFKARLARLAANAPATPVDLCTGCSDTGWAVLGGVAYACVCKVGQKLPATIKTIRDVADAHALRALFPHGVPTVSVGWPQKLEAVGVGRAMSRFTFDTFDQKFRGDRVAARHLNVAKLWIDSTQEQRTDLVMFGGHGRGKTGLAVAIARACVERRESVHFCELDALSSRIRATYGNGGGDWHDTSDRRETEQDVLAQLVAVGTLIVDEITGTTLSAFVDDKLRALVSARQRAERPTLLTLNVDAALATDANGIEAALSQILGPALYDRLGERGQFLPMFGQSQRTPKGR